ncbi:MAG: ATP-binding protein [Methyloprofundus sp.]|nr:ATP-binding protein [Methyloprofundus sp.]
MSEVTKEDLTFSVDARLIRELGEKLVTRDYLALAELIKNAYDADSDQVTIKFNDVTGNSEAASIIISDSGNGMSWDEVKDYWMRVSTSNKQEQPITAKYGRKKSGSKGIGRLACQKLAHTVNILTVSRVSSSKAQVIDFTVEWDEFIDGKDLINITCESERYETELSKVNIGTKITLKRLKESWNQRAYSSLQRQLASLSIASPSRRPGFIEDPGFNIVIQASEFEDSDYELSEKVLDASWGRLKGKVLSDGTVELEFHSKIIGKKRHILPQKYAPLQSAKFDITYFSNNKKYRRSPSLITQGQLEMIQESYGGVKVYSEGFRVYPYGEPGNDWLGLDRDVGRRKAKLDDAHLKEIANGYGLDSSRVLLDMFRNKSLVGAIHIDTNQNSNFSIKLNREGFVSTDASELLARLLRYVIEWMTIQYSYFKFLFSDQEKEEAERKFQNSLKESNLKTFLDLDNDEPSNSFSEKQLEVQFDNALKVLRLKNDDQNQVKTSSFDDDNSKLIDAASNYIKKQYDSSKNELTLLRAIASTGPLFFVFAHEFRSLVSHLDTSAGTIEQFASRKPSSESQWLLEIAQSLRSARKRFLSLESLIGVFASTHKTEPKKINIKDAVEKVCAGFEFITSGSKINIDYKSINERLKTEKMTDAAFYSILVNAVSNAIKAVLAKGERQIRIEASRDSKLVIRVEDKGIGLPEDKWKDVFLPLVTDPTGELYNELYDKTNTDELAVLGKGTGLGLNIVKGMVNNYGGTVNFVQPSSGWNTCLEIRLD